MRRSEATTQFVSVGPMRIRVRLQGHGDPLLLIMGIGGHLDMWRPLAERLPGRQLIAFDFPGTGESSGSCLPPMMMLNALIVRALLRRMNLARVDVLGYSWGGMLAQQLAVQHPGLVGRLILVCTGPGLIGFPADPRITRHLLTPARYDSPRYFAAIAPRIYGGRFRADPHLVDDEIMRRIDHPPSKVGYAAQVMSAVTFASLPMLPLVRAPTLILAGDDDPLVHPCNQHLMHSLLRRSRLELVPGGGHLLLIDSAQSAANIIESFLAETQPSSPPREVAPCPLNA